MDLSSLYNTLSGPPDRLQQAENEMMERFKGRFLLYFIFAFGQLFGSLSSRGEWNDKEADLE